MPGPLGLLCLLALGLRGAAEPSGAAPPLCAAPCSCDGDRRVDCSGKGLTAVPEGLSAFTQALSSLLKEFALGTTLAKVAFWKEEKLKPVTSQDEKMHDFGGDNAIYIVRVLSNQVTPA
ncbi:leucine-rich repeat-containing G-protein coupled receptor 4-like [Canis lupus familiaris]|uniref:leucine-rich repeat-containing G-protein coupled receptor 4-like n=1 Tax=Canis lupus familiaris TaxID=9615 RepID=UPI0018F7D1B5|nr:leucine-rich repeat-containing G-protein coupled receptor 4-like [Canis lupus familiaris]